MNLAIQKFNGNIISSPLDDRKYRKITLENNLDCLLVSDVNSEKSSACMDVLVGSMSDPPEAMGLAHFLEHMLFLGTEKYPEENSYSAYLNSHGGNSNAYTDQENTVYFFDVGSSFFETSLDMFASFFTCPLFTESALNREMNAVDSENSKNLQADSWRKFQLLKSLSRPDHNFNKFSTGNLKSLKTTPESQGLEMRKVVMDFYLKHYSANLMKLVVYGKEDLDQLESWVVSKFSSVPNKNYHRPVFESNPFSSSQLMKWLEIVPVRDMKSLQLNFPFPPVEHMYLSKPARYISHLVGHESGGSILAVLKNRLWANSLSCYLYLSYNDFAMFHINIELTEDGMDHIDEVIDVVFGYIGIISESGPMDWIWQEEKELSDMNFRFLNKTQPSDYAVQLANGMHIYSPEHILCGSKLIFEKNLTKTMELLEYLVPSNSLILVSHRRFSAKTSLTEEWYGTEYNMTDFHGSERLKRWESCRFEELPSWMSNQLHLPVPNPFIATDFSLRYNYPAVTAEVAMKGGDKYPILVERREDRMKSGSLLMKKDSLKVVEKIDKGDALGEESNEEEEDDEADELAETVNNQAEVPKMSSKHSLTWFLLDTTWKVPKLNVVIKLTSSFTTACPLNVTMTEMLGLVLKELMNENAYYADCAGLFSDVQFTKGGLELSFQGYNHKLPLLVEATVKELRQIGSVLTSESSSSTIGVDFKRKVNLIFDRVKEKLLRNYKNYLYWQPYYHCIAYTLNCLEDPRWNNSEKYYALLPATSQDFFGFAKQICREMHCEVLVFGNSTKEEAKQISSMVLDTLQFNPLPLSMIPVRRVIAMSPGVEYIGRQHALDNNPKEVNSAVENTYIIGEYAGYHDSILSQLNQRLEKLSVAEGSSTDLDYVALCEKDSFLCEATTQLLKLILSEPAFDQLRTKEQLGYIAFTSINRIGHQFGLQIIVQSSHKDPVFLDSRIESFLTEFREELKNFTDEKLFTFIDTIAEKLLEKPKNIDEECEKFWNEINTNLYIFDRKYLLVDALKSILKSSSQLTAFYDYFLLSKTTRTKFSSQFYGKDHNYLDIADGVILIEEPVLFKRSMSLLPVKTYDDNVVIVD